MSTSQWTWVEVKRAVVAASPVHQLARAPPAHRRQAFAYAAAGASAALINSLFIMYYVELYLKVFHLESWWFYVGQVVYLAWNALNDPLFAFFQDFSGAKRGHILAWRSKCILWGGMGWVLSFFVLWFPWTLSGAEMSPFLTAVHFMISVNLYDSGLTLVLLAHNALLADMTTSVQQRSLCSVCNSLAGVVGSSVAVLGFALWDPQDLQSFRIFICFAALAAATGFYATSRIGALTAHNEDEASLSAAAAAQRALAAQWVKVRAFLRDIFRHRNFAIFAAVMFIQQFNCTFNTNFFSIMTGSFVTSTSSFRGSDAPASDDQGGTSQSLAMYIGAFILPHFLAAVVAAIVAVAGCYSVIRGLLALKFLNAAALFLLVSPSGTGVGTSGATVVSLFLVMNRILTECHCRIGNLALMDVIDEDTVVNKRQESVAAAISGVNALLTKPAQSLAPILGWAVLDRVGARRSNGVPSDTSGAKAPALLFNTMGLVPLVSAAVQFVLWGGYTLRGAALKHVKDALSESRRADTRV